MSLNARVLKAVDTAFNAADDMIKVVTLAAKSVTGFDHVTQSPIEVPSTTTAVALEVSRSIGKDGTITVKLLMKAAEVPMDKYLTVTLPLGELFHISGFESNGYTIDVTAKKEQ